MNTIISQKKARNTIIATLIASALAAGLPQASFAQSSSSNGIWKLDPARSKIESSAATLTLERSGAASPAASRFVAVSNGSVYLVTGATASIGNGTTQVDFAHMPDGNAILIGTNARATYLCGFRCVQGFPERRLTLTFKVVEGRQQQVDDMLASDGPN